MKLTGKSAGYIDGLNYQSGRGVMNNETEGFHLIVDTEKFGRIKYQLTREQARQIKEGSIRSVEVELSLKLS